MNILKDTFPQNSVNFTHERSKNKKISFLDVLIDPYNNNTNDDRKYARYFTLQNLDVAKKIGNLKRGPESLLIAAQTTP